MAEEKKRVEEKRYAVLSRESVRMFADAVGHSDVSEDVFSLLAEDVTYRIREIAQVHRAYLIYHCMYLCCSASVAQLGNNWESTYLCKL